MYSNLTFPQLRFSGLRVSSFPCVSLCECVYVCVRTYVSKCAEWDHCEGI